MSSIGRSIYLPPIESNNFSIFANEDQDYQSFKPIDLESAFDIHSFEGAHNVALDSLNKQRLTISLLIDYKVNESKQKSLKKTLLLVITSLFFLTLFGASLNFHGSYERAIMGAGAISFSLGVFGMLIAATYYLGREDDAYKKLEELPNTLSLLDRQITLLNSESCIKYLKLEENKCLYPFLQDFELDKYIKFSIKIQEKEN